MQLTRNRFLRRAAAAGLALLVCGGLAGTSVAAARAPDAPHLPPVFKTTFTSKFVNARGLRQHVVVGGDGPPLLLVHGWPQNWYQYRALMPALARDYTVIAVDQRGMGLTEKPKSGYDSATLANDLVALMDALGHERFSVVGLDTGMVISYALAADHPERVARLVVGEGPAAGRDDSTAAAVVPARVCGSPPLPPHLQPARRAQRTARPRARGPLLQLHLRRRSHHQAPRPRRQVLHGGLRLQPRRTVGQLRVLPRVGRDQQAEPQPPGDQADDARPGHRRRSVLPGAPRRI